MESATLQKINKMILSVLYLIFTPWISIQSLRLLRIRFIPDAEPIWYVPFLWSGDRSNLYFYRSLLKRYRVRRKILKGLLKGPLQTVCLLGLSSGLLTLGFIHLAIAWAGVIFILILTKRGECLIIKRLNGLDDSSRNSNVSLDH